LIEAFLSFDQLLLDRIDKASDAFEYADYAVGVSEIDNVYAGFEAWSGVVRRGP
jgi:hypothetical protein